MNKFNNRNKIEGNLRKRGFQLKPLFQKKKGQSLMELMCTLYIFAMATMVVANIFTNTMNHYFSSRKVDHSEIAVHEALMYIDYYVNFSGEAHYIKDGRLYVDFKEGKLTNYIYLKDSNLRVAYVNEGGTFYTSQALLYGIKEFNLSENGKVTFVEIVTLAGIKVKKAIGRI